MLSQQADPEFLRKVPYAYAREHLVLWTWREKRLVVVVSETTDPAAVHNASVLMGRRVPELVVEDAGTVAEWIDSAFGNPDPEELRVRGTLDADEMAIDGAIRSLAQLRDADLLVTSGKSQVENLVNMIIFEAIRLGASDIHFQPLADRCAVRFRLDGALAGVRSFPKRLAGSIAGRIKVMGGMDVAESRLPQDGRAEVTVGGGAGRNTGAGSVHAIDLRISTMPTSEGERVVLRILDSDRGRRLTTLDSVGMPDGIRARFRAVMSRPNGMVLLTGPTGSGKTTTLYAALRELSAKGGVTAQGDLNIMTIEDPIEYSLSGMGCSVSQSQVNRKKGMSFASGLRNILRQDPDVVMIGEIRDSETARIAVQSSLTGHLVFSTLHTNDSIGAPVRLADLGIEPYLISSSLAAVLAQRLVRILHADCGGTGCEACLQTGFRGRTGVFEMLSVTDRVAELIADASTASELRAGAAEEGWRSLREFGQDLVAAGITTTGEVERVALDLGGATVS